MGKLEEIQLEATELFLKAEKLQREARALEEYQNLNTIKQEAAANEYQAGTYGSMPKWLLP